MTRVTAVRRGRDDSIERKLDRADITALPTAVIFGVALAALPPSVRLCRTEHYVFNNLS